MFTQGRNAPLRGRVLFFLLFLSYTALVFLFGAAIHRSGAMGSFLKHVRVMR